MSWLVFLGNLAKILLLDRHAKIIQVSTYLDVFLPWNLARSWQDFPCFIMFLVMAIKFHFTGQSQIRIAEPGADSYSTAFEYFHFKNFNCFIWVTQKRTLFFFVFFWFALIWIAKLPKIGNCSNIGRAMHDLSLTWKKRLVKAYSSSFLLFLKSNCIFKISLAWRLLNAKKRKTKKFIDNCDFNF